MDARDEPVFASNRCKQVLCNAQRNRMYRERPSTEIAFDRCSTAYVVSVYNTPATTFYTINYVGYNQIANSCDKRYHYVYRTTSNKLTFRPPNLMSKLVNQTILTECSFGNWPIHYTFSNRFMFFISLF